MYRLQIYSNQYASNDTMKCFLINLDYIYTYIAYLEGTYMFPYFDIFLFQTLINPQKMLEVKL